MATTERERMLVETKANFIEMRSSLTKSMDSIVEHQAQLEDDTLIELHVASDLLLAAVKQIELGMENAKKRGNLQPNEGTLTGNKVA